jgi:hypothetical protein
LHWVSGKFARKDVIHKQTHVGGVLKITFPGMPQWLIYSEYETTDVHFNIALYTVTVCLKVATVINEYIRIEVGSNVSHGKV